MKDKLSTISVYFSIKDYEIDKIEKLKTDIIQAIKDILAQDTPPKDITISFIWY